MPEKPLRLPSAKSGVLLPPPSSKTRWLQLILAAVGIMVVLVGAADAASRAAHAAFGDQASLIAFGPAAAIDSASINTTVVSSTTPLTPAILSIPSIGLRAPVEQVGNKADGTMGTPKNFTDVAWYALGPKPGQSGSAVIDGHVNNALTTAGVFQHLSQVHSGDVVSVSDSAGRTLQYHVVKVAQYDTNSAPVAEIFTTQGPSQLVLITCAGDWIASAHSFDKRLVVYAQLNQ